MDITLRFLHFKVYQSQKKNWLEIIIPTSFRCLCRYGKSAVIQGTFTEILLLPDLHFNNEIPNFSGSALNIENSVSVFQSLARMLNIYKSKFFNFNIENMFKESFGQMHVLLLTEDLFKSDINHRIDISRIFNDLFHNLFYLEQQ